MRAQIDYRQLLELGPTMSTRDGEYIWYVCVMCGQKLEFCDPGCGCDTDDYGNRTTAQHAIGTDYKSCPLGFTIPWDRNLTPLQVLTFEVYGEPLQYWEKIEFASLDELIGFLDYDCYLRRYYAGLDDYEFARVS